MKQAALNRETRGSREAWTSYRREIAGLMAPYLEGDGLVLGPGNGNDLEYSLLEEKLRTLTLVDLDEEGVALGLRRQGAGPHPVVKLDLLGFDEEALIDDLVKAGSDQSLMVKIVGETALRPLPDLGAFDTIVLAPVLTQLFLPRVFYALGQAGITPGEGLQRALLDKTAGIFRGLQVFLDARLKKGGVLVLWNDFLEFKPEDSFVRTFSRDRAEAYLEDYVRQYGMSPVTYGHGLLESIGRVEKVAYLIWPFNTTRSYLVKLSILRK